MIYCTTYNEHTTFVSSKVTDFARFVKSPLSLQLHISDLAPSSGAVDRYLLLALG